MKVGQLALDNIGLGSNIPHFCVLSPQPRICKWWRLGRETQRGNADKLQKLARSQKNSLEVLKKFQHIYHLTFRKLGFWFVSTCPLGSSFHKIIFHFLKRSFVLLTDGILRFTFSSTVHMFKVQNGRRANNSDIILQSNSNVISFCEITSTFLRSEAPVLVVI